MSSITYIVLAVFIILIFWASQRKFKNKMLCVFHRPNKTKIEIWVPLFARFVRFDQGKYGVGDYEVDPDCVELQWYNRGLNKIFPILIPTMEFWWDTPNPLNPVTKQRTWHTPEVRNASWEEHQHIAYAKAAAQQSGGKKNFLERILPLIMIGLIIITGYLVYTNMQQTAQLSGQVSQMQQQIKLGK